MTMYRDPIVWNEGQQLFGEEIRIYMNDSTIDWAHVVGQAFSAEQLHDSIHFNQVSSKEMKAFFEKGELREFQALDNVLVIRYPIDEQDSSLILQNNTETQQLKMFMKNRRMERTWTNKATGIMYPMSQIPPGKAFLEQFAWFDYVRPLDKQDIFNWRPKKEGDELKEQKRREAPKNQVSK